MNWQVFEPIPACPALCPDSYTCQWVLWTDSAWPTPLPNLSSDLACMYADRCCSPGYPQLSPGLVLAITSRSYILNGTFPKFTYQTSSRLWISCTPLGAWLSLTWCTSRHSLADTATLPYWPAPILALTSGSYSPDMPGLSPDIPLMWTGRFYNLTQPNLKTHSVSHECQWMMEPGLVWYVSRSNPHIHSSYVQLHSCWF